jgi:uncharacterized protein with GYD domain
MLFCFTCNYTPQALQAMAKTSSNRADAARKLIEAAGGKVEGMYFTGADGGPGAMVIMDVEPKDAAAINSLVSSTGLLTNQKMQRLYRPDEIQGLRARRNELAAHYSPPGQ